MFKKKLFNLVLIITVLICNLLTFIPVQAQTSQVSTSTTSNAVDVPSTISTFYAQGLWWVFYGTGGTGATCWKTSADGITWSTNSTLHAYNSGASQTSVWSDGTSIYAAYCAFSTANLYFRKGTLNSDGTITWAAAEQTVGAGICNVNSILNGVKTDSAGNYWIAYSSNNTLQCQITKSSTTDGTWTTAGGYPINLGGGAYSGYNQLLPLTSGKLWFINSNYSGTTPVRGFYYNGAAWGSVNATLSSNNTYGSTYRMSSVSYNDVAEVSYTANDSGTMKIRVTTIQTNASYSDTAVVTSGITATTYQCLTLMNNGDLRLFYFDTAIGKIYYVDRLLGVWQSPVLWIDKSSSGMANRGFTSAYNIYNNAGYAGGMVALNYQSSNSSPFSVNLGLISGYAPSLTASPISSLSMDKFGVTSGNFSAVINGLGVTNQGWFDFGTTVTYGSQTTNTTYTTNGTVLVAIPSSLTPGSTYHYRFGLTDDIGTNLGSDSQFTLTMPTISTSTATNLFMDGGTHATLRGTISGMGTATSTYTFFQWSYDNSLSNTVGLNTATGIGTVSYQLQHFNPNVTVFYRFGVQNGSVTTYGGVQSFTLSGSASPESAPPLATYNLNQAIMVIFIGLGIFLMLKCFATENYMLGILIAGVLAILIITLIVGMNGAINNLL